MAISQEPDLGFRMLGWMLGIATPIISIMVGVTLHFMI